MERLSELDLIHGESDLNLGEGMKGQRKGEKKQMDEWDMSCLQFIIMTLGVR